MALGFIEVIGLSTAMAALDAAAKSADVTLAGFEKVIGAGNMLSVTLNLSGEISAVQAAVEAGLNAGGRVGTVISARVIARPDAELEKMLNKVMHVPQKTLTRKKKKI